MYKKAHAYNVCWKSLSSTDSNLCFSPFWVARVRILTLLSGTDHEIFTHSQRAISQAIFKKSAGLKNRLLKSEIYI